MSSTTINNVARVQTSRANLSADKSLVRTNAPTMRGAWARPRSAHLRSSRLAVAAKVTQGPGTAKVPSEMMPDAHAVGSAFVEVFGEKLSSQVGEFLHEAAKNDAEHQRQVNDFLNEVQKQAVHQEMKEAETKQPSTQQLPAFDAAQEEPYFEEAELD